MKSFRLRQHFSAAHFYHQTKWSEEKNRAEFGKCFTEFGHGHDYVCEIEFSGDELIAKSAFTKIMTQLDHQHMNFVIPEFKSKIPTTENMALYIQEKVSLELHKQKAESQILSLRLFETPDIWVELT